MRARRRFGASEESVGAARRFVAGMIVDAPADVRDSVSLMVSELSTNALIHAATGFDVYVDRSDLTIFISVSDRGEGGTPVLQEPAPSEPHGRGLRIVDALSEEWGISTTSDQGKAVWFRMSLQPLGRDGSADGAAGSITTGHGDQRDQAPARPASPMPVPEESNAGTPSSRSRGSCRRSLVRATGSTPCRHRVRSIH
jgi:anti-sigma regulatory factor (Ser/Thr protein kinase)